MKKLIFSLITLVFLVTALSSCDLLDSLLGDNHEHTPGSWVVAAEPTCTAEGKEVIKCKECGEILQEETIAKTEHLSGDWETVTESSCSQEGLRQKSCVNCNKQLKSEVIPQHNVKEKAEIAATCLSSGLTKGSYCADCGEIFKAQEEISALGHDYRIISAVAPSCTSVGRTEGERCSRCYDYKVAPIDIPKISHNFVNVSEKAATCTETGIDAGSERCNMCGKENYNIIAALGHNYDLVTGICKRCDNSEYTKYTVWEEYLQNNYTVDAYILDIRTIVFDSGTDYTVSIKSHQDYIRIVGDEAVTYKNLFFVIESRSNDITIDFVNVNIHTRSLSAENPIIKSDSIHNMNIGFYGSSCKLMGATGNDGKGGTVTDLSVTNGYNGSAAIDAPNSKITITCASPSVTIKGGDGGYGGSSPSSVGDGGDGAMAIKASSIKISFTEDTSKSNITISGGNGGGGGHTYYWFENLNGKTGKTQKQQTWR